MTTFAETIIPEVMPAKSKRKKKKVETETRWGIRFHMMNGITEEMQLDKYSRPHPSIEGLRVIDANGASKIMSGIEEVMYRHGRYKFNRVDGTACMIKPQALIKAETYNYQAPIEDDLNPFTNPSTF